MPELRRARAITFRAPSLVKGRPRSPLNKRFNRASDELLSRRITSGATRMPVLRRCARPAFQSSQEIGSCIGIVGTPVRESFGLGVDDFADVGFIFIGWQFSNAEDFLPIDFEFTG